MKTIRLSSPAERRTAWLLSIFIVLLIILIFSSHNHGIGYIILISVCSLLAIAIAVLYLIGVTKAAIEISDDKSLTIHGIYDSSENYSGAVSVKTVPVSVGLLQTRTIVLSDNCGDTVCTIPTLFTSHGGVMAEPAAIELADALGLEFIPSVEKREYDPEAIAQHKAQLKAEKKEMRRNRRRSKSSQNNANNSVEENEINYDAMDDER